MAKARDFVSDYNKIRCILRDIFIYGCFTVDDFERKGISKSKYNQDKKKIMAFLDDRYINFQTINGKRALYFDTNMFTATCNYLIDSFMMKSFVDTEAIWIIKLLQIFSDEAKMLNSKGILETVGDETDITTLYRRLKMMVENGYLCEKMEKGEMKYYISKDIFENLDDEEIEKIIIAVDFFKNIKYPATCGGFLQDTLKRYMELRTGEAYMYESPFLIKHNHFSHVLDDDILWGILPAIYNRNNIKLTYIKNNQQTEVCTNPLKIIADEKYGRRYLFAVKDEKANIFRLDRISNIALGSEKFQLPQADFFEEQLGKSFTGATLPLSGNTHKVVLRIKEDVLEKIKGEINIYKVSFYNNDEYIVELDVNNPTELKPWLRTYMGKVMVVPTEDSTLAQEMQQELEQWRKKYEFV